MAASTSTQDTQTESDMAANFAFKAGLRKSMTKTLRGLSEADLQKQCELTLHSLLN
jgi:hypothetical protein